MIICVDDYMCRWNIFDVSIISYIGFTGLPTPTVIHEEALTYPFMQTCLVQVFGYIILRDPFQPYVLSWFSENSQNWDDQIHDQTCFHNLAHKCEFFTIFSWLMDMI